MTNFTELSDHTVYVARPEFLEELRSELGDVSLVVGNLVFSRVKKHDVCFAVDVWVNPQVVHVDSISEAVRMLRGNGKYWFLNPVECVRRSSLIAEQLPKLPALEHSFPVKEPLPQIGCFSLLDQNTLVFTQERWKNPPVGDFRFVEDKKNPPNRAYLKLWEALTIFDRYPIKGETAFDLGASPGGWTYVMQSLGVNVTAVDKAALDPKVAKMPRVTFLEQSAFALDPSKLDEEIDWLVCDVACYPDRLHRLIKTWLASNKAKRIIATIKLQGKTDFEALKQFQAIPGARVIQLLANKHEATFFYPWPPDQL